jgi:ribonuclease HII
MDAPVSSKRGQSELFDAPRRVFRIGEIERSCRQAGLWPLIGTDEVGRGPLAGPVVAGAVILRDGARLPGLDDSKQLSEAQREALVEPIQAGALAWSVVEGSLDRIERLNILGASLWAMAEAVRACWRQLEAMPAATRGVMPRLVVVDGNKTLPGLVRPGQRAVVKGDRRSRAIAAASILAKVHRDHLMVRMAERYPGYGFESHKGYPAPVHLRALERLGPTPIHRVGFAPVAAAIKAREAGP